MSTLQVQANGVTLEVERVGPESGETVLLIMGLGAQMILWPQKLVDDLVARGYQVVRFDNRDIGLSEKLDHHGVPNILKLMLLDLLRIRPKAPYSLSDMAADAVGVLDALGIDKAHIVGASMGGMIAQLVAAEHGPRCLSLTSIMSTTGNRKVGKPSKAARKALLAAAPDADDVQAIVERAVATQTVIGSPGFEINDAERRELFETMTRRNYHPAGMARQIAAIVGSGDRREKLKTISIPTVVFHGEDDPLVPLDGGEDTAVHIPGAELVTVPGMGHDLPDGVLGRLADSIDHVANRAREHQQQVHQAAE